ncbi:RES family NAD+ phosphorylase [Amaricoccus sp.]|uniref:RES family NAD+ phosphorylase n=1 Tax=Amaricoccus sp. TaxID=1872485 RepID=UPI001B68A3DE|nr:RES family NAD+ phosphorylase [Amaricoccus sp.]MBP6999928.1 RES family NAD+ phosphorylase [Amaricoccus sp.]
MSAGLGGYGAASPPPATFRLVPEQWPAIPAFDAVTTAGDLDAVLELAGWTDDARASVRLAQIPPAERVYGRPNASIVMAAFVHGGPEGLRFSGPELGAWYGSTGFMTAVLEVANGLRRELAHSAAARLDVTYREFTARLDGACVDIFGLRPELHDPDPASYPMSQAFGREVRDDGPRLGRIGIRYESVRRPGHENWVCFRPRAVEDVVARDLHRIALERTGKVEVRRLP